MESKTKLLGHPIHPMLVGFPIGLLVTSLLFDVIALLTSESSLAVAAFYMIGAGVIGGLVSAVFGLIDWLAIPLRTRAKGIGLWHGLGNVVAIGLFILSWLNRRDAPQAPEAAALIVSLLGVGVIGITGWLGGGELVNRLGVGVDKGANLNAPNSLSGRPASSNSAAESQVQMESNEYEPTAT
jgi:uncharacterized membrane protein